MNMTTAAYLRTFFLILYISGLNSVSVVKFGRHNTSHKENAKLTEAFSRKYGQRGEGELPVEPPLFVGSFNIQTLGKRKFNNLGVMDIVERVILRYDLIFLTELMDDRYIWTLLKDVNLSAPDGTVYNMTLSEKQPDTKEQYVYFYKTNKLKVLKEESYTDPQNFYRKPFVVIFEAFTLRDMNKFGVIGHHVKPSKAVDEINALAEVYDYVTRKYSTEDVLLMGDFNADCDYVKEKNWDDISLWTRSEFTWAITSDMDTTTNYRSCAQDRFVYAGENMNNGVILSSAGPFNFQREYELSTYETRNVSDHWPIELKIRSKMSDIAEKHLLADICFKVRDSRKRGNITTQNLMKLANKSAFKAVKTGDGMILSHKAVEEEAMLASLQKLRTTLPDVVSRELEEAVKYKVKHGSLDDESSFADIFEPGYKINILTASEFTEASICRTTSVN